MRDRRAAAPGERLLNPQSARPLTGNLQHGVVVPDKFPAAVGMAVEGVAMEYQ